MKSSIRDSVSSKLNAAKKEALKARVEEFRQAERINNTKLVRGNASTLLRLQKEWWDAKVWCALSERLIERRDALIILEEGPFFGSYISKTIPFEGETAAPIYGN